MSRLKQLKTILVDNKLRETTNLCVEKMNSKRQVSEKLGHVVQTGVCRFCRLLEGETRQPKANAEIH